MATATTNLELRKPDGTDTVDEELDLNANWDKVDATWAAATPSTLAIGDAPSGGSQLLTARSDHLHGMPAFGVPGSLAIGDTPAAGSSASLPRVDHRHGMPGFGTPVDVGSANASGAALTVARSDHVHGSGSIAGSTASATTLALPSGKYVPISGVVTITAITGGTAGREVTLVFASRNCIVNLAGAHVMQGPFISDIGGTLSLFHDGTIWHETGRSGFIVPGARYYLAAATTSIPSGSDQVVTWTANAVTGGGLSAVPVSQIVPGILGRWRLSGEITIDDVPAANIRSGHLRFNGSTTIRRLFDFIGGGANNSTTGVFATELEVVGLTDFFELTLFFQSTENVIGGFQESHFCWSYIGK